VHGHLVTPKARLPSDSLQNGIVDKSSSDERRVLVGLSVLKEQRCYVDRAASASCLESDVCELVVDALPHSHQRKGHIKSKKIVLDFSMLYFLCTDIKFGGT